MSNGLTYTASLRNVTVTSTSQNLWELSAAVGVSLMIRSIRIEVVPSIAPWGAASQYGTVSLGPLSSLGNGGNSVTPAPEDPHNTNLASTVFRSQVLSAGPFSNIEISRTSDFRCFGNAFFEYAQPFPISGGGLYGVNLQFLPLAAASYAMSSEICFEEF
jgi:hypothetical protein